MNLSLNNLSENPFRETQPPVTETSSNPINVSLCRLIDKVTDSLAPAACKNKSHIINNVSEEIYLEICEDKVALILSRLLNIVILHSENSCVRISSKTFNNIVLLHLKDDGCVNYDSISYSLTDMQKQAEKIGGFVGFTSYRNKLTTIAFSFTNDRESRPHLFN
jgi:glucose-6-phosphate-specific signal transduction histidine kinase